MEGNTRTVNTEGCGILHFLVEFQDKPRLSAPLPVLTCTLVRLSARTVGRPSNHTYNSDPLFRR